MTGPKKIEGARAIIDLPSGATDWKLGLFDGDVLAASPSEGVYVIRDGRAEKITPVGDLSVLGMPVYVDESVPADEVRFVQNGKIVGRIVGRKMPQMGAESTDK